MSIRLTKLPGISLCTVILALCAQGVYAQTAPSSSEASSYDQLHAAAHSGNINQIRKLILEKADLEKKDQAGRTPLHVAAYASHEDIIGVLSAAGADMNALEHQAYDIVTIAAVENDIEVLETALQSGSSSSNITSPYDGTALIAAAHLGHHKVVKMLIDAGAPIDHVNNLNWTALIEAVVLGDGGPDHIKTIEYLVNAGADASIGDRHGQTPLELARSKGFSEIVAILEQQSD